MGLVGASMIGRARVGPSSEGSWSRTCRTAMNADGSTSALGPGSLISCVSVCMICMRTSKACRIRKDGQPKAV
jgi:hypothetical protein